MCERCDYRQFMENGGIRPTEHRLAVLQVLGNATHPMTAQEVFDALQAERAINRVTVYRALESLVKGGVVDKISAGDRSFRYGLAPNEHHPQHAHFYCRLCRAMACLPPESLPSPYRLGVSSAVPGVVEKYEIRLDGICHHCRLRDA
ncbi:Fur family transcriptional regulator [Desulfosoma caldarium]|uniref:Fur family ferric uptake transcriptional regulator n=1 Tax=Desulfosoma caldarium TaxID=610254 RepID=A0A3N1US78_9BACT|nr:transcriptional repressor [Desulfosoma caldarium]ROQ90701.1 Fur family ferric uptake transcriptional regulator [Desulfosoma caldarium]